MARHSISVNITSLYDCPNQESAGQGPATWLRRSHFAESPKQPVISNTGTCNTTHLQSVQQLIALKRGLGLCGNVHSLPLNVNLLLSSQYPAEGGSSHHTRPNCVTKSLRICSVSFLSDPEEWHKKEKQQNVNCLSCHMPLYFVHLVQCKLHSYSYSIGSLGQATQCIRNTTKQRLSRSRSSKPEMEICTRLAHHTGTRLCVSARGA